MSLLRQRARAVLLTQAAFFLRPATFEFGRSSPSSSSSSVREKSCAAADASYIRAMGVWGRYESRAGVLGVGVWSGALCGALTLAACDDGSAGGSDRCAEMMCTTPPAAVCKTAATATTYAAMGSCSSGTCSYAPTDTVCGTNKECAGAGVCTECKADGSCGATCAACGGGTPRTYPGPRGYSFCSVLGASRIRIAAVRRQVATRQRMSADRRPRLRAPDWQRPVGRAGTATAARPTW